MKYHYYDAYFEPIDVIKIGGSKHCISFKALDYEHAHQHATKLAKWKNNDGNIVYRLVDIKEIC